MVQPARGAGGPLWQGRFKAVVLDWEDAGLEISRYIHLNPVRVRGLGLSKTQRAQRSAAGHEAPLSALVDRRLAALREHRWSSYRAYAGLWAGPPWLEKEATWTLLARGRRGTEAQPAALRAAYVQWVERTASEGGEESPWGRVRHQMLLGGAAFVREALGWLKGEDARVQRERRRDGQSRVSWDAIQQAVAAVKGEAWENFVDRRGDEGRDVALWLGQREAGMKLAELGRAVGGISTAAVSQGIGRIERQRGSRSKAGRVLRGALAWLGAQQVAGGGR